MLGPWGVDPINQKSLNFRKMAYQKKKFTVPKWATWNKQTLMTIHEILIWLMTGSLYWHNPYITVVVFHPEKRKKTANKKGSTGSQFPKMTNHFFHPKKHPQVLVGCTSLCFDHPGGAPKSRSGVTCMGHPFWGGENVTSYVWESKGHELNHLVMDI